MDRLPLARWAAPFAAALFVLAHAPVDAQPVTKAPPRLPPNAAQTSRIPAGVDTGSPATSQTVPLGTPVPPALGADRNEIKTRSAAARAAARPKLGASSAAGCARPAVDSSVAAGRAASAATPRVGAGSAASAPRVRADGTPC